MNKDKRPLFKKRHKKSPHFISMERILFMPAKGGGMEILMRKFCLWAFVCVFLLTACDIAAPTKRQGTAEDVLHEILSEFTLADGFVYESKRDAELPLTDAMLARMFPDDGDTADLFCVKTAAVYFSKRFSEHEILVFELCDLSHTEDIVRLLQKRAKKKENAVVISDGVYVFLICTDQNEAISRYLIP